MDGEVEILLTAAQINALPEAMAGLPTVERLRLGGTLDASVTLTGWRGGRRSLITAGGYVYRYAEDGRRMMAADAAAGASR